jgi:hypothetical protein
MLLTAFFAAIAQADEYRHAVITELRGVITPEELM